MRRVPGLVPVLIGLLLVIWGTGWGCSARRSDNASFDSERALQWVVQQCDLGPRPVGSSANRQLGQIIQTVLQENGWQVEVQTFSHRGMPIQNIVGKKGGAGDPIILGAHFDTRPRADRDPDNPTAPIPGANDGASGTAVLLELARVLHPQGHPIWLAFFDAEDMGEINGWDWSVGARYFASHLDVEPKAVVVIDMIGDADQQIFLEQHSTPALCQTIWNIAAQLGYGDAFIPRTRWTIIDDHVPFLERGWPACLLIDFDYPYWHTHADTPDKVSTVSLQRVGTVLETWLEEPSSRSSP